MRIWDRLQAWVSRADQRCYYWILTLALLLPNVVLSVVMQQPAVGRVLNILLMLPVYMLLLLSAKRPGRVYWGLFVLVLLHAFQLVLLTIFSGSVVAVDMLLNIFTSEPDEAGELLSNILWPILASGGFYALTFVVATLSARSRESLSPRFRRRMALVSALILLVALPIYIGAKKRFPYVHLRAEVYPMSVFHNMYLATTKLYEVLHYDRTSQDFCYKATSERAKDEREIYVLILGETSRAHSWSLYGYPRETTPHIDSLHRDGGLIAFADVLTQSNTTYKSIPIILSPADASSAENLPHVQGILSAFREAGFYTAFISNQPGNHSYVDFFAMQGDEHHPIRKELRREKRRLYDSDMIPYLQRLMASEHPKLFVVLHTYGSHFSYRDRYPKEDTFFPVKGHYSGSEADSLVLRNAYDNAVRQTDKFVDSVVRVLEEAIVLLRWSISPTTGRTSMMMTASASSTPRPTSPTTSSTYRSLSGATSAGEMPTHSSSLRGAPIVVKPSRQTPSSTRSLSWQASAHAIAVMTSRSSARASRAVCASTSMTATNACPSRHSSCPRRISASSVRRDCT